MDSDATHQKHLQTIDVMMKFSKEIKNINGLIQDIKNHYRLIEMCQN